MTLQNNLCPHPDARKLIPVTKRQIYVPYKTAPITHMQQIQRKMLSLEEFPVPNQVSTTFFYIKVPL
jgi:hypothetical protein